MPDPSHSSSTPPLLRRLGLTTRTWLIVAAAFAFGLLLFLAIWMKQRNANDFFRAGGPERNATGEQYAPLPVPDTTATESANLPAPAASAADPVPGAPLPASAQVQPAPPPGDSVASAPAPSAPTPGVAGMSDTPPVPVDRPAPRFPQDALRRGESGDVVLRIHVDADGSTGEIDLVRGSGSRQLDRAATDAAKRWRFRPAMRGGVAVDGAFETTISFKS